MRTNEMDIRISGGKEEAKKKIQELRKNGFKAGKCISITAVERDSNNNVISINFFRC